MALRKWLRDKDIYDKDLEEILSAAKIEDPETDFANISEDTWDEIYRKATVERFQELKDQDARARLEKKLTKLEKEWRSQSGIVKTNIKKNMDVSNPKEKDEKEEDKAMLNASELKKFLQDEEMWEKDLFLTLVQHDIICEDDIKNISEKDYDNIEREVRVLRADELKDQNSKARLEKLLSKFEKYWRKASGIKKSNIKGDLNDSKKEDANPKSKENQKLEANKELKKWMQDNNVWEKDLFNALIAAKIQSEDDLKNVDENTFDEIVRKVRVERFSEIKDQATRTRLDKLLTTFEKEWRKLSGIKKTAIKPKKNDD